MKAINYKMKKLNRYFNCSKKVLETCNYPEHVLRLQNERQILQKSNINLLFFCEKPVSKPVNS